MVIGRDGCHSPVLERREALLPLLELSPRMSSEMPLKLLALVMAGFRLRFELSESVLLHGRGSEERASVSELLWRLVPFPERPCFSLQERRESQRSVRREKRRHHSTWLRNEGHT